MTQSAFTRRAVLAQGGALLASGLALGLTSGLFSPALAQGVAPDPLDAGRGQQLPPRRAGGGADRRWRVLDAGHRATGR